MSCSNERRRLGPSESYERFKARARIRKAQRKSAKVSLDDLMDAFKGLKLSMFLFTKAIERTTG